VWGPDIRPRVARGPWPTKAWGGQPRARMPAGGWTHAFPKDNRTQHKYATHLEMTRQANRPVSKATCPVPFDPVVKRPGLLHCVTDDGQSTLVAERASGRRHGESQFQTQTNLEQVCGYGNHCSSTCDYVSLCLLSINVCLKRLLCNVV
jgi:hypothetical protein